MGLLWEVDIRRVARARTLPLAFFCLLCLCAAGPSSSALASPAAQARANAKTVANDARAHHPLACAIRSSFHSTAAHPRHILRSAHCLKRRAEARKRALLLHAGRREALAQFTPSPTLQSAAGGGACSGTTLRPSNANTGAVRAAVLCLVNRERTTRGERPLIADAQLTRSAQAHTESMALENYLEHVGPNGETPLMRMRATGYISSSRDGYEVGENIGWGTLWDGTPRAIVAAWMASAGHRANILDARFRNTGIGVSPHPPSSLAHNQAGGIYTEDFGVLIPA
jgi:uncharacterized protein YkwD